MPKDPTKNIFQYKIRGGHLNEFEFQQNQGQVTEQHDRPWEKDNFDPNAALPGHDPESASPKAQAKHPRAGSTGARQPAKADSKNAMKKASKKTRSFSAISATSSREAVGPARGPPRSGFGGSSALSPVAQTMKM